MQASAAFMMRGRQAGGDADGNNGAGLTPALAGGPSQQAPQRQLDGASTIALFEDVYQRQQQAASGAQGLHAYFVWQRWLCGDSAWAVCGGTLLHTALGMQQPVLPLAACANPGCVSISPGRCVVQAPASLLPPRRPPRGRAPQPPRRSRRHQTSCRS